MPQRDVRSLLQDIVEACDRMLSCTSDMTLDAYRDDWVVRAAVERQFEVIGEAMKRLTEVVPALSLEIPEAREAINFRNFLAHGYHLIDHGIVWSIVKSDVRPLRDTAHELLNDPLRWKPSE